jgi:V8-like Glu-specific endopeptidase
MTTFTKYKLASQTDIAEHDDLQEVPPIRATEEMPAEIAELLRPDSGIYIRSEVRPTMDFELERLKGPAAMWRVVNNATRGRIGTTIPGREQQELQLEDGAGTGRRSAAMDFTPNHRPTWLDQEFLPGRAPFRLVGWDAGLPRAHSLWEPKAREALRPTYPWCTVGEILVESSSGTSRSSGVLVGPNLVLTAGHAAPWGAASWSMEFIPSYRRGERNPRPFGSSFVERIRGYHPKGDTIGYDYVICKLYQPLGKALGWMGTQSWAEETVGQPAEIYGSEPRHVNAGYRRMVQLVRYGLDNWRP